MVEADAKERNLNFVNYMAHDVRVSTDLERLLIVVAPHGYLSSLVSLY